MTTKRTHGPCTCAFATVYWVARGEPRTVTEHAPDCPALYPAQQELDALTRLERYIRAGMPDDTIYLALSLISEARAEQRKARNAGLERAAQEAEVSGFGVLAEQIRALKVGP